MLSLSSSARYFLYDQPTDMRCGVYSLAGLVTKKLGKNVLSRDIFIFIGMSANQIRLLQWDGDGFALYIKRLGMGTFERPLDGKVQLGAGELMLILQSMELPSGIRCFSGISQK